MFAFTCLPPPRRARGRGHHGRPGRGSSWTTTLEVAGTDEVVRRAIEAGGACPGGTQDFVYGRMATITDPFGAEFTVITRPETPLP